ncbi:glucose-6-phosphate isomerase [Falsihalocynthiibacter sp. CO-5D18]|uniref:glucose-6-phosphate isomerase n=1 Tax=Falsihalocynthiibacter sp. CO-5D18 TaxID=3240872 RepID=UPI00350FF6C4
MRLAEPMGCRVDVDGGMLGGHDGHYKKLFSDLSGLYSDAGAFEQVLLSRAEDIAYEVTSVTPGTKTSDLIMGVTRMEPGKVGHEYFMTRGHIHSVGDRPEIYYGQAGNGLMLMESPEGDVRIIEVNAQTICYVPPFWIHRSVNVGDTDLVMMFAYPADSGQDYGIIARSNGMRTRIVDDGQGGWQQASNPDWTPRSQTEIAAIYHQAGDAK